MFHGPNFGNPLLNFLAWIVIIIVTLLVLSWLIDLVRDLFDDDPVAMVDSIVMATTGWDLHP